MVKVAGDGSKQQTYVMYITMAYSDDIEEYINAVLRVKKQTNVIVQECHPFDGLFYCFSLVDLKPGFHYPS